MFLCLRVRVQARLRRRIYHLDSEQPGVLDPQAGRHGGRFTRRDRPTACAARANVHHHELRHVHELRYSGSRSSTIPGDDAHRLCPGVPEIEREEYRMRPEGFPDAGLYQHVYRGVYEPEFNDMAATT